MVAHELAGLPMDCGCDDDSCASIPAAFVRLRFFLGKHMGVADFSDLQAYPAAKTRFHNQNLHGSGVVVGLGLGVMAGSDSVLRVKRGAALDRCGREIVVGYDQCIDVDAWVKREKAARHISDPSWPTSELDEHGLLPLAVVVRYRDCPVSPEPAPRDPCGCDDGGCQYGRIREGFELALMSVGQVQAFVGGVTYPALADLDEALARSLSGGVLAHKLAELVTQGASDRVDDAGWMVLGGVKVTLDSGERAIALDVAAPPRPRVLLEGAVLQELLVRQLGAQLAPGALVDGAPTVEKATLEQDGSVATTYRLRLALSSPILAATLAADASQFRWMAFSPTSGWSGPATNLSAAFDATGPAIVLTLTSGDTFLAADGYYRLALVGGNATPIVDAKMRPLRPLGFAWDFRVTLDAAGVPTLGRAPFAE